MSIDVCVGLGNTKLSISDVYFLLKDEINKKIGIDFYLESRHNNETEEEIVSKRTKFIALQSRNIRLTLIWFMETESENKEGLVLDSEDMDNGLNCILQIASNDMMSRYVTLISALSIAKFTKSDIYDGATYFFPDLRMNWAELDFFLEKNHSLSIEEKLSKLRHLSRFEAQ